MVQRYRLNNKYFVRTSSIDTSQILVNKKTGKPVPGLFPYNMDPDWLEKEESKKFVSKEVEMKPEDIKNKVLIDLIVSPETFIPMVGGFTSLVLSWAFNSALLCLFGIGGVLVGGGLFFTKLIFGLEKITEKAYNQIEEIQERKKDEELTLLREKLCKDRDPRTQDYFDQLITLRDEANTEANTEEGDDYLKNEVEEKTTKVFNACINQLEYSYKLYLAGKSLKGPAKKEIKENREKVLQEVEVSIEHLSTFIKQYLQMKLKPGSDDLSKLREELTESMEVARRVEERMSSLDQSTKVKEQ